MPGPDDIDRKIARSKGVRGNSLIAVESNAKTVKNLRKSGVNVISGDIKTVIQSWESKQPIKAVLADYCSGIERSNWDTYNHMDRPALRGACLMINLQRGRDPWSEHLRKYDNTNGWKQCNDIDDMHKPAQPTPKESLDCLLAERWLVETAIKYYALINQGFNIKTRF